MSFRSRTLFRGSISGGDDGNILEGHCEHSRIWGSAADLYDNMNLAVAKIPGAESGRNPAFSDADHYLFERSSTSGRATTRGKWKVVGYAGGTYGRFRVGGWEELKRTLGAVRKRRERRLRGNEEHCERFEAIAPATVAAAGAAYERAEAHGAGEFLSLVRIAATIIGADRVRTPAYGEGMCRRW